MIDGEHIRQDKHDSKINLFAAFDIYCVNKKSTRSLEFYPIEKNDDEEEDARENKDREQQTKTKAYRLVLLKKVISNLNPTSIMKNGVCDITIICDKMLSSAL